VEVEVAEVGEFGLQQHLTVTQQRHRADRAGRVLKDHIGDGSAEPTLDVVPGVAAPGQVVTVFGAGFPAGAIVEFSRLGVAEVDQLAVDPDGTFAHVFVVLPNTPSGPMTLMVAAQPDLFGDVAGELLVSGRTAASTAVFRDGLGASLAR
jgi:hypothetical protein